MLSTGNVLWIKPWLAIWGIVLPLRETSGNILRLLWPAATTGSSFLAAMVHEVTLGSATQKADDEVQMLPFCQLLCCWQWDDKPWYSLPWPPAIDGQDVNWTSVCICCWENEGSLKTFKGSFPTFPPICCSAGFDWMKLTSGCRVVPPETLLTEETFCWGSIGSSIQEQVGSWGISGVKIASAVWQMDGVFTSQDCCFKRLLAELLNTFWLDPCDGDGVWSSISWTFLLRTSFPPPKRNPHTYGLL